MKKKFLAAAIGAMLVGGSAMAVELAHGGKGDLLIAPLYMAGGGWTSEVKVINSNLNDSVVAKVVVHAPHDSRELLDFLLILSPGDVGVFTLKSEADGSVTASGADDSLWRMPGNINGCPTTAISPLVSAPLTQPYTVGYIDILQSRVIKGLGAAPVSKQAIANAYSAACLANPNLRPEDSENVLSGSVRVANSFNGNVMALPMTALQNHDQPFYLDLSGYTGFNNLATTSVVEDALWSSDYVVPFNNAAGQATFATVTFPTKEGFLGGATLSRYFNSVPGKVPTVTYGVRNEQEVALVGQACNISPCPVGSVADLKNEVNLIAVIPNTSNVASAAFNGSLISTVGTAAFDKGWINIDVQKIGAGTNGHTGVPYTAAQSAARQGSPALVTYMQWNLVPGTNDRVQGTWMYAPSTNTYSPGTY